MGERLLCKQEVVGSIPSGSTKRCYGWRGSSKMISLVAAARVRGRDGVFIDIVKRLDLLLPCVGPLARARRRTGPET